VAARWRRAGWGTGTALALALALLACGLDSSGTGADPPVPAPAASTSASSSGGGPASGGAGGHGDAGGAGSSEGGGAGGSEPQSCDGEDEFFGGDDPRCYRHVEARATWEAARAACVAWGGDLAALSSNAEYNFVYSMRSTSDFWIGARSAAADGVPSGYTWSNGEPWGADGWATETDTFPWKGGNPKVGEPCVKLHNAFETKACNDEPSKGYLCERR
jgi:hypothetical protein